MKKYRFLISGGGTGGHIYPAISIADELSKSFNSSEILFVGSSDRMEMKKVPENGYNIKAYGLVELNENCIFPTC